MGLVYPSFESRGDIARLVAARARRVTGRAIPTARRSIPAAATAMSDAEREARIAAGEPYALRLDMAAAHRARR